MTKQQKVNHSEFEKIDLKISNSGRHDVLDSTHKTETIEYGTSKEIGGPKGLEPTRYGDWEIAGRCSDF